VVLIQYHSFGQDLWYSLSTTVLGAHLALCRLWQVSECPEPDALLGEKRMKKCGGEPRCVGIPGPGKGNISEPLLKKGRLLLLFIILKRVVVASKADMAIVITGE
jgi:hypothetical protein